MFSSYATQSAIDRFQHDILDDARFSITRIVLAPKLKSPMRSLVVVHDDNAERILHFWQRVHQGKLKGDDFVAHAFSFYHRPLKEGFVPVPTPYSSDPKFNYLLPVNTIMPAVLQGRILFDRTQDYN